MDWKECNDKKLIKKIKEDKKLSKALTKSSKNKLKTNNLIRLDKTTASTKVGIIYDSIRELLEALAIKKGYKIYNHDCFCAFLDEICKDKKSSKIFDKLRRIRNKINYYGVTLEISEAKEIIREISLLRKEVIKKYFKNEP